MNRHGISGLNVPPKDARALAEAVMAVAGDGWAYAGFTAGAERRYRETFTRGRMIDNVLEIYTRLWKEPKLSQVK